MHYKLVFLNKNIKQNSMSLLKPQQDTKQFTYDKPWWNQWGLLTPRTKLWRKNWKCSRYQRNCNSPLFNRNQSKSQILPGPFKCAVTWINSLEDLYIHHQNWSQIKEYLELLEAHITEVDDGRSTQLKSAKVSQMCLIEVDEIFQHAVVQNNQANNAQFTFKREMINFYVNKYP